jgi:transposase-like protein
MLLVEHIEGTPIRKLAKQNKSSKSVVSRIILNTLSRVPNSNHISELSCKYFGRGILFVDGKYLHVKGYKNKIPLIWVIDEYSHDPLIHELVPSENYQAYRYLFLQLKKLNYPLQVLICDEHPSIIQAIKLVYPKCKIQLCTNHFKENVRRSLKVRSKKEHKRFMDDIEGLFKSKSKQKFSYRAKRMLLIYSRIKIYQKIMMDINDKFTLLTTHYEYRCPSTTNLIECFNSHLQARLASIKGFESFKTAQLWLNAYVMNRRLTKFTDCGKHYKKLNGLAPIQLSAKWETRNLQLLKKII